jgi:hypothetical protein
VELKKFSKKKKKPSSKAQGLKGARTWALKAKERTSVLKNQSKNQERERLQSRAVFIYNRC